MSGNISSSDLLLPEEICRFLPPGQPWKFQYFPVTDSTNAALRRLVPEEPGEFIAVLAEEQLAGRGRLQRSWHSPPGSGIWLSVLFRPGILPAKAQCFSLLAAVAVREALAHLDLDARIKWPNDLLCQGKKICGILSEMQAGPERINWLIIGLGLNVNTPVFPLDLRDKATSLALAFGHNFSRPQITALILQQLEANYLLLGREGFAPIAEKWRQGAINLGQRIRIAGLGQELSGIALDVDQNGYLLLEQDDGSIIRITAGDVLAIREAKDQSG
ncbi:MAG: biotin--[acetyl-CoA-carboxylase] ligase [Clostridiales bacterium]|jgi:BirA family biotin operon repressor/biotin-[acetyl-CoA-carboxylase] ligase|nr:biotin--[acetyl-CoA-carboxylase] ligase [Clostridiales bacterium]